MSKGYKVNIKTTVAHEIVPHSLSDEWLTKSTHEFLGISPSNSPVPDIVDNLDLEPGSEAFVVWAIWSEGDSCGMGEGCCAEAFGIFPTKDSAEELAAWLRSGDTPEFVSSAGQYTETYLPWWGGCHDSLDSVQISPVRIP